MKTSSLSLVTLAALGLFAAGCRPPKPEPTPRTTSAGRGGADVTLQQSSNRRRSRPAANAQPGDFDFYLLNLSWSPEFCHSHPGNAQCAARPGFIVHGLWPQNSDGTYLENCPGMSRPPNPAAYLDIMPTVDLILHEWQAHGTCSGLNPDGYFFAIRTAFRSVAIPSTFATTQIVPDSIAPAKLLAQFSRANPSFPPQSFALSCGNNYLTAVEVCMDKHLSPEACRNIRSCRANVIRIAPR